MGMVRCRGIVLYINYLMHVEQVFRWSFIALFVASASISKYYRRRARMSGEAISRRQEGQLAMLLRGLFALPVILSFFAYMLNPRWMAWSMMPLPIWVRWVGVGLGTTSIPLLWWVFSSIGSNISETVLTKREHSLITSGAFRWVRHPLYSVTILLFGSYSVIASNWWMMLFIALALVMIVGVVIPREEEALVARFGKEYEDYRGRAGRLLPWT